MARVLALVVLLTLALPVGAGAASVELRYLNGPDPRSGRAEHTFGLIYVADPGEANRLTLTRDGNAVDVRDAGATIRAGENCVPAPGGARCTAIYDPAAIEVSTADLGDLADEADLRSFGRGSVRGGDGDDTIRGDGFVTGGPGADTLEGGPYSYVDGGPGADRITGSQSSLEYDGRTAGLSVTFDGIANDGEAGEGDDIRGSFMQVDGGPGDDLLEASGNVPLSYVNGFAGNDRLVGSEGDDRLVGWTGDDMVEGRGGNDEMNGDAGSDVVRGGPGIDGVYVLGGFVSMRITLDDQRNDGMPGENDDIGADVENVFAGHAGPPDYVEGTDASNQIDVGGGGDTVLAKGGDDFLSFGCCGATTIDLGPGRDSFHPSSRAQSDDTIQMRDGEPDAGPRCETGATPAIVADAVDDLSACASFLRLPGSSHVLRAAGRRAGSLSGTCVRVGTPTCTGGLRLYRRPLGKLKRVLLARGRYDVPAGKRRGIALTLTETGRRLLARAGRVKFIAGSIPDLNPPPSVIFPATFETTSGVVTRGR